MARRPNDECSSCQKSIPNNPTYLGGKCRKCYNEQRRKKYNDDETLRKKTVARQCEKRKVDRAEIAKQKTEDMKNEQEMLYGLIDPDKKICRRCEKPVLKCDFRKNSHICKDCDRAYQRGRYRNKKIPEKEENTPDKKICKKCDKLLDNSFFSEKRTTCKKCRSNEDSKRKKEKKLKEERENMISIYGMYDSNRKICKTCENYVLISDFYNQRRECKNCRRKKGRQYDSVYGKKNAKLIYTKRKKRIDNNKSLRIKMCITDRIYKCIRNKKNDSSVNYLGCTIDMYSKWIRFSSEELYSFDNHGTVWHIDHVIPLSTFDFTKEEDIYLAFNWRNTTPLDRIENMKKGNKILTSQIEEHFKKLKEYHYTNKIELPKEYIELFARNLVAGNSLEPTTTTQLMET